MAKFRPALEQPPEGAGCCACFGVPPATCPGVGIVGKQCTGSPTGLVECGFLNPEDDLIYKTRVTTNTREVRTISPAPATLSCTYFSGPGGDEWRTTVGTMTVDVPYVSELRETCEVNIETLDCECESTDTDDVYTLTRQVVRSYANSSCTGAFFEFPGSFITEVDPGTSVFDEITYEDEIVPQSPAESQASAEDNAALNCSEDFTDTPIAVKEFLLDGDGVTVLACSLTTCETKILITGGSTGYIKFSYGIMDELGAMISTHEVEYAWDPTLGPADATLPGPSLDVDWPPGTGGDDFRLREVVFIEIISCTPP